MKKNILLVLFLSAVLGYGFIFQKNALRDFKDSIVGMAPEEGKSLSHRNSTSMLYFNPADLNYIEDFEGTHGWEFTNGTQVNKWYVGTAVNNGGTKSLYISNNNGTANTYTTSTTSVTQAYKQIAIPANTSDVQIGFDWRADGEGSSTLYDYFRVWVVPETFTPTPGTQIAAGGGRVQVGGSFNLNPSWTTYNGVVNLSAFAGQNVRLVFEWRNDGSAGTQPPVAIDNVVVKGVTCSSPTNLVLTAIDATSAQLSWSAPITANVASYDYYYSTSPTAPTTPSGNTTATTVTIEGLSVYTQYYFWVRTNCGTTDGSSFWTGPIQITTTQNPAPVDFTEGFEGDTSDWTFTNGNQTNKWIIGTAVSNGGTKSLYITNNNGTSNAYTTSSSTTTHAIRDLAFPVNASEATLSFDWRAIGEGTSFVYDYFKVWLVPVTYNPVPGTLIADDVEGAVQIGGTFNQQGTWQSYSQLLDVNAYAGQARRLIFEWRNDSSGGTQPPAAIDNVEMKLITCPRPINIQVQKNNQGNMVITWQPTGTETQWEIIILPATDPPPTDTTTGIIVNGTPQYIYTQGQQGVIYNVYIRAVCGDADKSLWTDPVQFSDFNPPACADLDVSPLDLNVNENGEYIFCEAEGEVTINLDAQFDTSFFKSTSEYTVESIDYDPPFPFTGGTPMNVSIDDTWSPVINLPFSVCFYDNHFTKAQVGSNGMVVFGTNYTPNVGGSAPYSMTGYTSFPDPQYLALGNGARLKNCILGVYQDIDPSITTSGSTPNINYQVLGTYPCRALVVNFNDVDLYSNFNGCATSNPGQYYQIVIYEITNIIEVYVGNRNSCAAFNDGKGVIGLINEDHTAGTFPPNRNIGTWTAQQEAWRFRPNGETSVTFGWYANGQLISTNPQHAITISETTHFEARISYPGCGDEDFEIVKDFTVKVSEEVIATKAEDIELCVFQGEIPEVNLRDKDVEVLAQIENTTNFEVNYYETFNGADTDTGRIPTPENYQPDVLPKTIYVRVENTDTECYATTSFNIVPKEAIKITKPDNIIVCVYNGVIPNVDLHQVETKLLSQIPDQANHIVSYHNSQQEAVLNDNPIPNADNYQADGLPKTIYVRVSNISTQCEAITSFQITAGNFLDPYSIDDVLICTNYVLPTLPNNYYYSTEQIGKGTVIAAGTVYGLGQHTLYINIDSENGCVTSTQFDFEVVPCTVTKGISPNGDGLNDNFDLTLYHPLQVVIYNRDGREVYTHGPGYTNQWYGQDKNGKELPDGTYFYKITTATEVLSGYVQVLREIK